MILAGLFSLCALRVEPQCIYIINKSAVSVTHELRLKASEVARVYLI